MDTIVGALKGLYEQMGGSDDTRGNQTISEMIDKVTSVAGGGSGGGAFTVTFSKTSVQETAYTASKTASEIYEAQASGQMVLGVIDNMGSVCGPFIIHATRSTPSDIYCSGECFASSMSQTGAPLLAHYMLDYGNALTIIQTNYTLTEAN